MDYFSVFGANVRALRIKIGLSQEQLAEKAAMHRTYIGSIELGKRNISLKNIIALSQALGVKPYELLKISKEENDDGVL